MMTSTRRTVLLGLAAAATLSAPTTWAQSYPRKPITIVVAFAAGAGTDQIARLLAEKLSARLGQPVVVENKVGAAGVIGTTFVAKAPADGYTLLFTPSSIAFAQLVVKSGGSASYDPLTGFHPIIEIGKSPVFLVTGAGTGFKSFRDVAAAARTRKLDYGSAGTGSILHIIGEVVNKATGVNFVHVPYRGVAPAIADVLAGHIPLGYGSLSTVKPFMAGGRLLSLAVTSKERTTLAPDVPSLAELGYKGVDLTSWYGLFSPTGTPEEVTRVLNQHINEIIKMPEVTEKMALQGATPVGGTPEGLARTLSGDVEVYSKIIKELSISAD